MDVRIACVFSATKGGNANEREEKVQRYGVQDAF